MATMNGNEAPVKYYGKYRGNVTSNLDPMQRGRIQVQVKEVNGYIPSTWVEPCLPFGGMQSGMYVVPTPGSGVWVEFEKGDPDHPIWTGVFYGSVAEVPALALAAPPGVQTMALQTVGQNSVVINDVPGGPGIMIKGRAGGMIIINDIGITITNGVASIVMTGPTITINGGALIIT